MIDSGVSDALASGSGDRILVSAPSHDDPTFSTSNRRSPSILSNLTDLSDDEDDMDQLEEGDHVDRPLQMMEVRRGFSP